MNVEKKIRELEKRIELLEKRGPKGTRLKEISSWIMDQFKEKETISVYTIMKKGRRMGYSDQMISRARRTYLMDEIGHSLRINGQWYWRLIND